MVSHYLPDDKVTSDILNLQDPTSLLSGSPIFQPFFLSDHLSPPTPTSIPVPHSRKLEVLGTFQGDN